MSDGGKGKTLELECFLWLMTFGDKQLYKIGKKGHMTTLI